MKLPFTKMHGLGNDFVVIDGRRGTLRNTERIARQICDRRFGIGADQLLILRNSPRSDFAMRILNADGSEVEMCGNGIRCLARYVWENRIPLKHRKRPGQNRHLSFETPAGIISVERQENQYRVDMGEPILEGQSIPVRAKGLVINHPIKVQKRAFRITAVSMGNPHAVVVVKNVRSVQLDRLGPAFEYHSFFPKRTNTEFIQILSRRRILMRVWERGSGETLACGTGASAAVVASSLLGLTGRKAAVQLSAGSLMIEWSKKDNHVYMTGPAERVFDGTIVLS